MTERVQSVSSTAVKLTTLHLKDESIRLCDLLKLASIANSGGQGKHLVADGEVTVDGRPESRKTARIRAGQTVQCRGVRIDVQAK
jgi:ribosome-associated protein